MSTTLNQQVAETYEPQSCCFPHRDEVWNVFAVTASTQTDKPVSEITSFQQTICTDR